MNIYIKLSKKNEHNKPSTAFQASHLALSFGLNKPGRPQEEESESTFNVK